MTTLKQVRAALDGLADSVSARDGGFTARRGFFYTHGYTADRFVAAVKTAVPGAVVTDSGEVWKPFRGGAAVGQQSHWFVKFRVENPPG